MKESIQEAAAHVVHDLERYLNTLGTIAAVAPLLGLLGTVVGMIDVFAEIMVARHRQCQRSCRRHLKGPDYDGCRADGRDSGHCDAPLFCWQNRCDRRRAGARDHHVG